MAAENVSDGVNEEAEALNLEGEDCEGLRYGGLGVEGISQSLESRTNELTKELESEPSSEKSPVKFCVISSQFSLERTTLSSSISREISDTVSE